MNDPIRTMKRHGDIVITMTGEGERYHAFHASKHFGEFEIHADDANELRWSRDGKRYEAKTWEEAIPQIQEIFAAREKLDDEEKQIKHHWASQFRLSGGEDYSPYI